MKWREKVDFWAYECRCGSFSPRLSKGVQNEETRRREEGKLFANAALGWYSPPLQPKPPPRGASGGQDAHPHPVTVYRPSRPRLLLTWAGGKRFA